MDAEILREALNVGAPRQHRQRCVGRYAYRSAANLELLYRKSRRLRALLLPSERNRARKIGKPFFSRVRVRLPTLSRQCEAVSALDDIVSASLGKTRLQ